MQAIILISLGGALGALSRFAVGKLLAFIDNPYLPYATLFVNIFGCFLMGLCAASLLGEGGLRESYRLALVVGLLGGFTTFSAYSFEVLQLFQSGAIFRALLYIVLSNTLALLSLYLGYRLAG